MQSNLSLEISNQFGFPLRVAESIDLKKLPQNYLTEEWLNHFILPIYLEESHLGVAIFEIEQLLVLETLVDFSKIKIYLTEENFLKKICNQLLHKKPILSEQADQLAEKLLSDAIRHNASDIHFDCDEQYTCVRLRIDGILHLHTQQPIKLHASVISYIKILANLDIAQHRLPQDGRFQYNNLNLKRDCRVSFIPTLHGEKCVIRLLNTNQTVRHLDQLGLEAPQKNCLLEALNKPQGLILVTGPTGSGKTQTLYAALHYLNQHTRNLLSIEDPIEIDLPGINQVNVNPEIGLDFAKALRAFLRQDPDVIMLGEIRDTETAQIALRAAHTGHLVLATLHTRSAYQSINRLIHMGAAPYNVASALNLLIGQRLVRKLCPNCCKPDIEGFQAVGCSRCYQGYSGRTGVFECLPIHTALRQHIAEQHYIANDHFFFKEHLTLWQHGEQKMRAGKTSLTELYRVLETKD